MEEKNHYYGLTNESVLENRKKYGENILTPPQKASLWSEFLEKFKDPIIIILLTALILSVGVSFYHYFEDGHNLKVFLEPAGIGFAVLLATCVGFAFEVNANKKFEVLNQINDDTWVNVIRNGNISQIPRKEVVVGDIVLLETGDEVPADGKLLESISLQINESTLTGEPIIKKTTIESDFDKDATYPSDRIMKGTTVIDGHGIMEVFAVGDATEYGKVYEGSQIENKVKTPLNKQLDTLGKWISIASYTIASIIIVARLGIYLHSATGPFDWIAFGSYFLNTCMIAITLIVVAVPEGLPMSVTLSLALSMKRMLATNNLVRKMHACETMGAATVICTDKTGTLTQNQMNVYQTNFYGLPDQNLENNEISHLIEEGIAANSTAHLDLSAPGKIKTLGNPTEAALLLWLNEKNINYATLRENVEVLDQLTFSTERKYMATLVYSKLLGKKILYVKGAPEIVFAHCPDLLDSKGLISASGFKSTLDKQLAGYQNQAMRTLGFAYQIAEDGKEYFKDGKLADTHLTYLGIVAISDPVRKDVPEAVKSCLNAGIQVKIVTGDTPGTAKEIGRQIGLWKDTDTEQNHITGTDFATLTDEELRSRVMDIKIMSRARPMDKSRLVRLLQEKDQVVAVTGDGTNDAPALNSAQVGLSMGDGTSVAKEASAITILDNSFSSITRAVMWGRSLYQNIQRFIVFQMTINVTACIIVLIGAFLGTQSPITVTQMLWVNLIMDTFAAMALASLPPNPKVMKEKPRKANDYIITKKMAVAIFGTGCIFVFFLFGLLQYFNHTDITSLSEFNFGDFFNSIFNFTQTEQHLSPYELSVFFTIFVMLQFWNMFNAKAFGTHVSTFKDILKNKTFLFVAGIILLGQYLIVTFGDGMFSVIPLSWSDWGIIILSTSIVLWVREVFRLLRKA